MPNKTIHASEGQPRHGTAVLVRRWGPFVYAILLSATLLLAGCSSRSVRFADQATDGPMVILGDSLAAGYGVEEGQGFVSLLEKRLGAPIVNLSTSGITTKDSLPRVKAEVLPLKPSLVIIELGGNDALQRVDPAVTKANLEAMIAQVQDQGIPVMLLGVRGGLMHDDFADVFESLSREHETALVPNILDGVFTSPALKIDSVHPNAQGHEVVANTVEPELRRVRALAAGEP